MRVCAGLWMPVNLRLARPQVCVPHHLSGSSHFIAITEAFATADIVIIKSFGVGMAVAVALDATIVRALLVPATMRLLGR